MTNNTPDYEDNLYFEKIMTDCKNCPFTDEYCASGDCEKDNDLTKQWKKGKLPCGWYYIKIADIVFIDFFEGKVWKNKKDKYINEVLAPVPSYKKLNEILESEEKSHLQADSYYNEILELKELLKECKTPLIVYNEMFGNKEELLTKIDEVLK